MVGSYSARRDETRGELRRLRAAADLRAGLLRLVSSMTPSRDTVRWISAPTPGAKVTAPMQKPSVAAQRRLRPPALRSLRGQALLGRGATGAALGSGVDVGSGGGMRSLGQVGAGGRAPPPRRYDAVEAPAIPSTSTTVLVKPGQAPGCCGECRCALVERAPHGERFGAPRSCWAPRTLRSPRMQGAEHHLFNGWQSFR